jgi:phospholipase D1/2
LNRARSLPPLSSGAWPDDNFSWLVWMLAVAASIGTQSKARATYGFSHRLARPLFYHRQFREQKRSRCPRTENPRSDFGILASKPFGIYAAGMGESVSGNARPYEEEKKRALLFKVLLVFCLLLAFPVAWRWTPISEWINFRTIVEWQNSVRAHPAAVFFVIGIYVAASLVLFPVTVLNVATVFTFGPIRGNAIGLAGWLASAAVGYCIGRAFKHRLLNRLARSRIVDRLLEQAEGHGFLAVLTMRLLPIAPFTLGNIFVGTTAIRFRDFFLASLIGRIPGMIFLTFAGLQVEQVLRKPEIGSFIGLAIVLAVILILAAWFSKYCRARHQRLKKSAES